MRRFPHWAQNSKAAVIGGKHIVATSGLPAVACCTPESGAIRRLRQLASRLMFRRSPLQHGSQRCPLAYGPTLWRGRPRVIAAPLSRCWPRSPNERRRTRRLGRMDGPSRTCAGDTHVAAETGGRCPRALRHNVVAWLPPGGSLAPGGRRQVRLLSVVYRRCAACRAGENSDGCDTGGLVQSGSAASPEDEAEGSGLRCGPPEPQRPSADRSSCRISPPRIWAFRSDMGFRPSSRGAPKPMLGCERVLQIAGLFLGDVPLRCSDCGTCPQAPTWAGATVFTLAPACRDENYKANFLQGATTFFGIASQQPPAACLDDNITQATNGTVLVRHHVNMLSVGTILQLATTKTSGAGTDRPSPALAAATHMSQASGSPIHPNSYRRASFGSLASTGSSTSSVSSGRVGGGWEAPTPQWAPSNARSSRRPRTSRRSSRPCRTERH